LTVTPNLRFRWQVKFFASLGLAKVERLRLQLDSAGGGSGCTRVCRRHRRNPVDGQFATK
jgi:hypothetical protein